MSGSISAEHRRLFENLFVLELANNHWGDLERGLRIVREFGTVARVNAVRTAIKLQFRDVVSFIHPAFKGYTDSRYIKKTEATKLSIEEFRALVEEIRRCSCIPMATPFDEASADLCGVFDLPLIKIASSDIATWPLLERIARLKRPVIISTGGANEKTIDDCVAHAMHVARIAGTHRVGLGSDVDGGFGREQLPVEIQSPAEYVRLLDALEAAGFERLAGDVAADWRCAYSHANLARILTDSLPA